MQYLGKIPYALYILHEPVLRVLGWKLVLALRRMLELAGITEYSDRGGAALAFVLLGHMVSLTANLWWKVVDGSVREVER